MFSDSKDKKLNKAFVLENKGDAYFAKNKFKKALDCYEEALELNETRVELYDKLIKLHEAATDTWTEEDFSYNLALTMKKQELVDPTLKRIHARSEPNFREITHLIQKMLKASDTQTQTDYVEAIVAYETEALYPLIDMMLRQNKNEKQDEEQNESEI